MSNCMQILWPESLIRTLKRKYVVALAEKNTDLASQAAFQANGMVQNRAKYLEGEASW